MNKRDVHILLIEDDPDDAELAIHALEKHVGNHLFHIDSGEKALKFLFDENNTRPGVILLDLRMPRVDGIQILRKLKEDPERRSIPVIALVSSREGRHYVESFDLKADGYIQKPVDHQKFMKVAHELGLNWLTTGASLHK